MAPVRLDNLTAVTVTDRCNDATKHVVITDQDKRLATNGSRTSGAGAGVQRQVGGSSPQDLLLGLWPLFFLVTLLLGLRQAKLETQKMLTSFLKVFSRCLEANGAFVEFYLFGGAGRIGEDGLPVGPHKHDEGEVEEGQVDDWRETSNRTT